MKKLGKIAGVFVIMLIFAAGPAFSQDFDIDGLNDGLNDFIGELANSLPFNSTIGLNWSDAHIGKLPKFGLGLSVGFTPINFGAINGLLDNIGAGNLISDITDQMGEAGQILDVIGGFPFPAYTFDIRIGGFGVPFDLGFKLGWLDTAKITVLSDLLPNVGLNYLLIGGDLRYAILDTKLLKLSIGIGYNHMNTKVALGIPIGDMLSNDLGNGYRFEMEDPMLDINWSTNVVEAKAQISFPLWIITPYAGVGASVGWSTAGYGVNADAKIKNSAGQEVTLTNDLREQLEDNGFHNLTDDLGFSYTSDTEPAFNFRAFGGISLNLFVFRLDLTAMYDLAAKNLGASVGLRFQL